MFLVEIIRRVSAREDPSFRPIVPEDACKVELHALMKQCWHDDHVERPQFSKILDQLRKVIGR